MSRAATTLAGPCTGAPRRDFRLGLRHGQLVGAHVPSWCSRHGVDAGCSQRAGPPGQLRARPGTIESSDWVGVIELWAEGSIDVSSRLNASRSRGEEIDRRRHGREAIPWLPMRAYPCPDD